MRNQYYLCSCCGTRCNVGGRGNGCRRPNCLITLSGQCGSTAISNTMAAVVIHNPWFSVQAEEGQVERGWPQHQHCTAPTPHHLATTDRAPRHTRSMPA